MAWAYLNIRRPLVAWLVYRGEMVSSNRLHPSALSVFHTERLRGAVNGGDRYRVEVEIEAARRQQFPEKVSRLQGFYVFPDRLSAERAQTWGAGFDPAFLTEVGIRDDSVVSQYDAEWITEDFATGSEEWIEHYLAGEPRGSDPVWEQVVDGRALIYGTDTRTWAHSVVEQAWPGALGVLELARLAVELGSDLGFITASAQQAPQGVRIRYIMEFADAENPEFLSRLAEYQGPKDGAALAHFAADKVAVPDLTPREFLIPWRG